MGCQPQNRTKPNKQIDFAYYEMRFKFLLKSYFKQNRGVANQMLFTSFKQAIASLNNPTKMVCSALCPSLSIPILKYQRKI